MTARRRIVSVIHYYPPHIGGMEIVARKQATSLAAAGYDSRVATLAGVGERAGTAVDGDVVVRRSRAWNVLDRLFGIPVPVVGPGVVRTLRHEVRRCDLVDLHDVLYQTSWIAFAWALWYGKPIILTQHVGLVAFPSKLVIAVQRLVHRTWGRAILRRAARVVVYNANVREFVLGCGVDGATVRELHNGIDTSRFTPAGNGEQAAARQRFGLPGDRPLCLFVGRLVPKKGYGALLDARDPTFDVVIVGSGTIRHSGRREPGVHLLGPRSQDELAELYRACDLFVLPSTGELFTLAMQEAMASGLPVVVTDEPAYARYRIDRHLVRFVEPDPEALRAALVALVADAGLRAEMGRYSRELACRWFDWDENVPALLRIHDHVLGERVRADHVPAAR